MTDGLTTYTGDGVQPQCGPCLRFADYHNLQVEKPFRVSTLLSLTVSYLPYSAHNSVSCDFDSDAQRKRPIGGGKVASLQREIGELSSPSKYSVYCIDTGLDLPSSRILAAALQQEIAELKTSRSASDGSPGTSRFPLLSAISPDTNVTL